MIHPTAAKRTLVLSIVGLLCGLGAGSVFFVWEYYEYAPVRFMTAIPVIVPLFGLMLYFWTQSLREVLSILSATALLGGTISALMYLTPLYVFETVPDAQRYMLTTQAFSRFALAFTLGGVLLGAGVIVGAILRNEVLGGPTDDWTVDQHRRSLIASTGALTVSSALLGASVVNNYATAFEHREYHATIDDGELQGDELSVTLSVPNALAGDLQIDSIVMHVTGEYERLTWSTLPEETVPSDSSFDLPLEIGSVAEVLDEDPETIRIDGYVNISAFASLEERMLIDEYEVSPEEIASSDDD